MKPGKPRFEFQIDKIKNLINQSVKHHNQPLWLFLHDLRTPMFMLEGLSKLYAEINDEAIFIKLKEQFKLVEDTLGAVDYFASFQKEFASDSKIPNSINDYFKQKTNEKLELLDKILKNEGWLDGKKFKSIAKKLDEIKWDDEATENKLLIKFYGKQIKKINAFVEETGFPFSDIEEHVHEIRRRIRWLSIYPQALQGAVKFSENNSKAKYLTKYLTPDIVNSPFNVLPVSDQQTEFLIFDKNKFLALSSVIAQLGVLKDKGLKINALKGAFQELLLIKDKEAYEKTYALLGKKYPTLEDILSDASKVFKTFFEENNLEFVVK